MSELTELYKKMHEFRNKIYAIPERVPTANSTVDFSVDDYQAIMIDIESIATGLGESDFFYFCEYVEGFIKSVQQENTQLKAEAVIALKQHHSLCAEIAKHEHEAETYKARIASLRDALILCHNAHDDYYIEQQEVIRVLNETPRQSLVEIQADYLQSILTKYDCGAMEYVLRQELEQLRSSVKDGSDDSRRI